MEVNKKMVNDFTESDLKQIKKDLGNWVSNEEAVLHIDIVKKSTVMHF